MANNRIKGITIELNGDTTGLTDALKDVNKESGKVTNELKEVERALKFDPGNAELISQKQQLLAEQIQNTSQKLDVLRTAQSQVEAQFRNGEIGAEQYRAFQRELATTEAQMQQYNAQMANTANEQDRLARTTRELSSFFEATGTDVNQFADLLGTRLTSAIRDGSATTDQMNRALRLMGQHALGAGADIDQMRQALRRAAEGANLETVRQDLARITQEANQAEEAVNGFGQELSGVVAGLAAGGGIAGTIQQALDVSKLNTNIDISMNLNEDDQKMVRQSIMEVTSAIGDEEAAYEGVRRQITLNKEASMETNQEILKGAAMISGAYKEIDFKELIQESFEIGKELKISQKEALALTNQLLSVGFPTEQLDIIAEYGGQLQRAGFDAKQVQGIMAAGVETGTWNIDNLLDGLKEGRIKAAEMGAGLSTSMVDALQIIGASEEQFRLWGVAIAQGGEKGNKAFQDMTQYLMNVEDDVARNVLGVELFGTMWEDQGENIAATILNMNNHMQSADDMQKRLNDDIAKINADPAYTLSTAMGNLKEALAPLLTDIAQLIAKIADWVSNNAGLASAIVAIVTVIGILVGVFAALMPAIGGLVTAWPILAAIIGAIASPITLVVAAIVGLGIALVAAYHNSETFRENVNKVFQAIRDVAVTVFETVASFIGEKIAQIKQFWDENGTQILKAVENVFNGIKAVIEFVMPAVKFVIETVWNAIKQVIDGALNIIMGAIKVFSGLFTGDFSKMWEGVKQIFKGAIDLVVGWMTLSFFGGIKTIVMNLAKTGVNILKSMWDDIARFFTSMGSKVSSTVSNFSSAVLNFFKNLATNTGSTISNMVTSVINFVKNLATNFVNIISNMKTNVINKMNEIKDGLINKIKSLPEQFTGIGKDIINGLIKGISAMTANAIESITGVVDGVVSTAKKLLGIHSPSRVFKQIGLWTGEGLVIGLDSSAPEVNKAMENIGNGILAVSQSYQKEYLNLIDEFNKKNEDKNDKTLEKIYKIQSNAAKKKRALTQKEKQDIALLEASYRDNKMKSEVEFQKKYKALVEKSEKEYLEVIKKFIDDKKSLDEMSVVQEAAIWEQSIELFAEGSKERISAQKEYQKAVETVNKEILAINQDYQSQMQKINDDLIKQENDLTKAYEDAFTKRQSSLMSFAGLFDEFKIEIKNSGTELLGNLQSQVDGFKLWQEEFAKLSSRNIDADLLAELSDLGVKALPELMALNQLTNEQLTQYSSLYQEKSALARQQTEKELAGMKEDTDKQIIALREVASKQLDKLKTEWSLKIKSITSATSSELSSLQQIGVDAGQGLLNGLASMEGPLVSKAQQIANAISATIQQALDIHSPSRVMKGFGMNIGQGLIIGMDEMIHKVAQSSQRLSDAVSNVHESLASNRAKSQANANTISSSTTTIDNRKTFAPVIHNHGGANDNSRASEKMLKRLAFQLNY
ncbi:hypothetical protein [Lysinibacillus sp. GbtcB16]|uniref:hypothetical protein n=1 Tax=Lysinibacillus sp. GbtcB16 TaxID=2824761 RepID=UPI001C30A19C|nr:hypothetical protein [Lysinibacillus sp. GbtcB16]